MTGAFDGRAPRSGVTSPARSRSFVTIPDDTALLGMSGRVARIAPALPGGSAHDQLPQQIDSDAPVFVISVAAQLAGMHPQTLRTYDRMGWWCRAGWQRGRRYSARDIARLRLVHD